MPEPAADGVVTRELKYVVGRLIVRDFERDLRDTAAGLGLRYDARLGSGLLQRPLTVEVTGTAEDITGFDAYARAATQTYRPRGPGVGGP